jgi:hypothetical protein
MTSLLVVSDQPPNSRHGTSLTYSKLLSEAVFENRYHFYSRLTNFEKTESSLGEKETVSAKVPRIVRVLKKYPLLFDFLNCIRICFNIFKNKNSLLKKKFDFIYVPVSALNSMLAVLLISYILPSSKIIIHFYDDPLRYIVRSGIVRALLYKYFLKRVCMQAHHIFSISKQMAGEIELYFGRTSDVFSCPIPDQDSNFRISSAKTPCFTVNLSGSISNKWLPEFVKLLQDVANKKNTSCSVPIIFQYIGDYEKYEMLIEKVPESLGCYITHSSLQHFELCKNKHRNCYLIISGFNDWAIQSARTSFFTKIPYVCRYGMPVILYCPNELYIAKSAVHNNWAYHVTTPDDFNKTCYSLYNAGDLGGVAKSALEFASQFKQSKVNSRLLEVLDIPLRTMDTC